MQRRLSELSHAVLCTEIVPSQKHSEQFLRVNYGLVYIGLGLGLVFVCVWIYAFTTIRTVLQNVSSGTLSYVWSLKFDSLELDYVFAVLYRAAVDFNVAVGVEVDWKVTCEMFVATPATEQRKTNPPCVCNSSSQYSSQYATKIAPLPSGE